MSDKPMTATEILERREDADEGMDRALAKLLILHIARAAERVVREFDMENEGSWDSATRTTAFGLKRFAEELLLEADISVNHTDSRPCDTEES